MVFSKSASQTASIADTYEGIGEPVSVEDAKTLADFDPYQFQWAALALVQARPAEQKKGMDRGIDARDVQESSTPGDSSLFASPVVETIRGAGGALNG